uniref:Uncharacterized protein n=1 Tax=Avena sativa TaxID=4498 RepID=A0ACD5ZFW1_AVESA
MEEDRDSDSLPAAAAAATDVSTSVSVPQAAAMEVPEPEPSRMMVISEGEIQRLKRDLMGLSSSVDRLTQELDGLCTPLVDLSETEDPTITAKSWMKQVRELCYDTGDYLHDVMRSGAEFRIMEARAKNASETFERYNIQSKAPSSSERRRRRLLPAPHADLIDHVHKDMVMVDKVDILMGTEGKLKVVSILGPEGVGKTTLAKRIYRRYIGATESSTGTGTLHCWAFVRVSAKPDIQRLLTSIFTQIQRKRPSRHLNTQQLIDLTAQYLQDKRYFIIIDDLWSAEVWDTVSRAFPHGDCCSRIITTTQTKGVALACCGHQSKQVFTMVPLSFDQSRSLFFRTVFGSESGCPTDLLELSDGIIRKCGGLPLATIHIVSMLPSTLNMQEWTDIRGSLPSTWSTRPHSEWIKEVVTLMYSTLRPHLKTCLLYFGMYPVGYIVRKDDLVKQWVVEGFLDGIEEQGTEEVAGNYFDELVRRGMIQPVNTNKNGKVLSCTLHRMIHDVIVKKSMEENFVITMDYFQSAIPLPDKVRRLSIQFGVATSAHIPDGILVSKVRSLAFFGLFQCLPSIHEYSVLRVLILHISSDQDKGSIDLAGIGELLRLRYLKIACNIIVKLPEEMQGQQYLETLEVEATLSAIPWDIGELSRLCILSFAVTELSSEDICTLQELVALTALSVYMKTPSTECIVVSKGGFCDLKFFTFWCNAPFLMIEENAMPNIQKLKLCFNAHGTRQDGKKPITIRHLPTLQEIYVKIGGTVSDAGSTLEDAVTNHARNPIPVVQLMESREDQEYESLEEQDEIMEEYEHEYTRTEEKGLGERENMEGDTNETQNDGTEKDENKYADSRISMLTGSASRLAVPATIGLIMSLVFTGLVDKALSHMEPAELYDNVSKLAAQIIPQLKLTVEAAESSEDKVFLEKLVRELKSYFNELEETKDDTGPSNQVRYYYPQIASE